MTTSGKIILSDAERELVAVALSQRIKNVVYVNCKPEAELVLKNIAPELSYENKENKVTVALNYTFVINDIIEIIGGIRRERKDQR